MNPTVRVYFVASVLCLCVLSFVQWGCSTSNSPSDLQPGAITGVVSLWGTNAPLASSAGVTVMLDNSKYSIQTDSTGHWTINNVAPGNYDVTISKAGFGLCRAYGIAVAGPGTAHVDQVTLATAPTDAPVLSNVTFTSGDSDGTTKMITGEFSGASNGLSPVFFLDVTPNLQPGDAHAFWQTNENNRFGFSLESIRNIGIPSGTKVYISASEVNYYSVLHYGGALSSGTYNDPIDNSTRFISPGPRSNVVAVTIP